MIAMKSPFQDWMDDNLRGIGFSAEIHRLLALAFEGGKQYEREECALICDEADKYSDWPTAANCAAEIRARKD